MAQALHAPNAHASPSTGWIVLLVGSAIAFVLGAAAQILVFLGLGLCVEANEADCAPGTVPTAWEWMLATVPTYLLWVTPAVIAAVLGYRAMSEGDHAGRTLMVVSIVLATGITVAAAAMWWL